MTIIKTHLRTTATDHQGNIKIHGNGRMSAFSGVFQLGLIMGSQDDETKRLPVDDDQLPAVRSSVLRVIAESQYGLSAIGRLISTSDHKHPFSEEELYGLGSLIQNLALLSQKSLDHIERIDMDVDLRNQAKESRHES